MHRPGYVNPADLKASELRALLALLKHGHRAPMTDGHVFTSKLVIRFAVCVRLMELGLLYCFEDGVELSRSGQGIARIFLNRPILGYD